MCEFKYPTTPSYTQKTRRRPFVRIHHMPTIPSLLHSGVPSVKPSPVHCRCYEWIKRGQHQKGPHYLTDSRVTRAPYRANGIGSCSICYFRFLQFFANPILEMWVRVCVEQLRFYRKEIQHKRTVLGESDDLQHPADFGKDL